eukprot:CAMPEP_0116156946 /NCGR_PEP_ID=MMETSP0329-20121206/23091_1 /TAXON_ID=697910 /ORGANISM="Pseudo-nitzschia arenysensis, Strain B593" /LENGTH=1122 /DNA_ID=CAMNT_0003654039 /DNA_START=179 /DNA_END=3547 /DNA_ORIENTATION=-
MEGEGSREAGKATASPKKGKEHYANTDREIDQEHLAELLRKSADIVERGEFGSVLYEALQDFRVYYKQKYPKNAKKKKVKKEHKSERAGRSIPIHISDEKPASSSSDILDELKQSEDNATAEVEDKYQVEPEDSAATSTEEKETKLDPDGHTDYTVDQKERSVGFSDDGISESATTDYLDTSASANIDSSQKSVESAAAKIDDSTPPLVSEDSIPAADPVATTTAEVSEGPQTPVSSSSIPMTGPADTATFSMPMPNAVPEDSYSELPNLQSPFQTTPQKVGFGKKFKLGANFKKGALNMKKAAKNVKKNISENIHLDKRTSSKARDELEFFTESGIDKAESSNRRTSADYFAREGQSRVTRGLAGASNAGSQLSSEHEQLASEKFGTSSSDNHHGRSGSDFGLGEANTVKFAPRHQPEGYNSYQGETSSDNGDLNYPGDDHQIRTNSEPSFDEADPVMECDARPKFQRPDNQSSPLVVSGWIEQYRRSKMRLVWKEVLASLVEGRKPGEVTTLWIQREMINPATGEKELESLHRIPLQILEDVTFTEHTTDYQFRLKVYNSMEEFVFRCDDAPNDALRWVQTLKKYERLTKEKMNDEEKKMSSESNPFQQQEHRPPSTKGMPIRDLRAICHGAGVNTAGMERSQLEAAADEVQRRGTFFDGRGAPTGPSSHQTSQQYVSQQQQQEQYPQSNPVNSEDSVPTQPEQQQQQQQPPPRMAIKELRAICHGAGINTAGMERRELEAAAQEVQNRGTYFDAPIRNQAEDEAQRARREELRRRQQQEEEIKKRKEVEERHRREVEVARQRAAFAEQESRRRAAEEEARRRAAAEDQRRRAAAEEARRRAAAEEQMRRQREAQEAQKRYAQQQAAWQQQKQAEEQRRRAAEQHAAAERRRRDEAMRKEKEWAAPAPGSYPQQQQYHHQQQQRHQGYPPQQWQQQQQQHHHPQQQQQQHRPPPQHAPQARHTPPPPQQQQQRQHSGADNKYAKMASQSDDDGQAAITKIKHSILIQWALQPPQLQMLRPIAALVTTIHTVYPPALGVKGHEYFKKWKPISREELAGANGLPEEAKLKKAVRKIRFFLHPDKLPHDLDEEQKFTVKMLWDITNDSWEEYQKHKEDLDWVN